MFSKLVIAAALVAGANAACPNSCSGHGTCGASEVCSCYDGWGMGGQAGGDCSDRYCPYELAWVDSPNADGATHNYAECAGKGICDRETGECECFGGYEGKACARQSCPDSCSGHGTCEFMSELTYGNVFNDYYNGATFAKEAVGTGGVRPATDYSWDSDRSRACACDSGWSGVNCAARQCPQGNDALDTRANTGVAAAPQVQTITLLTGGVYVHAINGTSAASQADFVDKTFALSFTSQLGERYTTTPVALTTVSAHATLATRIQSALLDLPNKVIDGVTVSASIFDADWNGLNQDWAGMKIKVTFSGDAVHGTQNLLEVNADPCGSGCTPRLDGLVTLMTGGTNITSSVKETTTADFNSFECGRRGKCDSDTGICSCFEGFTGEACTTPTALV